MNKAEFIKELKDSIRILDDSEQQYFVEEYTQHIDMKMSQGMSEEEAVGEMGSIKELSREILESYHVKVDGEKTDTEPPKPPFLSEVKTQSDKLYGKIAKAFHKAGQSIKAFFVKVDEKQKEKKLEKEEAKKERKPFKERFLPAGIGDGQSKFGIGKVIKILLHAIAYCIKTFFYACVYVMIFLWNICCFCVGLFFAACLIFLIFMIGLLFVMLTQGYPVVGMLVGSLGAALSAGAVIVTCFIAVRSTHRVKVQEGGEANA